MGLFGLGKKDDQNKNQLPTSLMLMMRIIVGLYLAYLAYSLFEDKGPSDIPRQGIVAIAALFIVAGGIIIFFAVRDLLNGNFQGGSADTSSEEADTEAVEETAEKQDETATENEELTDDNRDE